MKRVTLFDSVLLLFCALVLRGTWFAQGAPRALGGDEPAYHALAIRLAHGEGFVNEAGQPTAWRTPGLPFALSVMYAVMGADYTRARLVLVVLSSLTALALYGLCQMLFHRRSVALMAGLFWAAWPTSQRLSGLLFAEPLAALCLTGGLFALLCAERRASVSLTYVGGVLLSHAVLTRVYLLLAVFGPVVWLIVRQRARLAAALLLALGVVLGGWCARNAIRVGTFALSTQTSSYWLGNNAWAHGSWDGNEEPQMAYFRQRHPTFDRLDEVGQSRLFVQEAVHEVVTHPGRVFWLLPRKMAIFFSPYSYLGVDWLYAVLVPFCLIGVWPLSLSDHHRSYLWLLAVPVLAVLGVSLMTFGDPRFRHPVDPLLIAVGCVGLQQAISWVVSRTAIRQTLDVAHQMGGSQRMSR